MHKPLVVVILTLLILTAPVLASDRANKFLVIHLDGVASDALYSYLEAGYLPAIEVLFAGGQKVKHGVTVFPGETPLVLTRMRQGLDNSEGLVGWAYIDQTGNKVGLINVFLEMMDQVSRLSRNHFIFQYPGVNHLVGLSLFNIGRYWQTHDVLEVYWINSDSIAHLGGQEAQLKSLQRFDGYLGRAAKSGQFEGANLVLYTDHGSTLDDVTVVKYQSLLPDLLGDELRLAYYPNIYLTDPTKKVEVARRIITETPIDLTFIRESEERVVGYALGGSFEIQSREKTYQYTPYGSDYFGYDQVGYNGEFLSKEAWLTLTKDHLYPAAIPSIFTFVQNPDAGDIVFVINGPQIPYYVLGPKGHHAGLTRDDFLVSMFLKGPAFEELEPIDEFWIHEAFTKHLHMVDFDAKPSRERHSLGYSYPHQGELVLSPAQRWRGGLLFSGEGLHPWVEYDIYSSLLTRFWVGAGYGEQTLHWRLNVEALLGNFKLSWLKQGGLDQEFGLHWRFSEHVELNLGRKKVGVTVFF
jgi:hypothetical protein